MSTQYIEPGAGAGPQAVRGSVAPSGADAQGSSSPTGVPVGRDEVSISPTAQHLAQAAERRPEELELRLSPRELRKMMEPTPHEQAVRERAQAARAERKEEARADAAADSGAVTEQEQAPVIRYDRAGVTQREPQAATTIDAVAADPPDEAVAQQPQEPPAIRR